jgi:hypothetical protein
MGMVRIFFITLLLIGFIEAIKTIPFHLLDGVASTQPEPAAVAVAPPALLDTSFNEEGTLLFYPNNVGPVPYIAYTNANGNLTTKALVFPQGAPSLLSEWQGARIAVAGSVDHSSVIVNHLEYLSPP